MEPLLFIPIIASFIITLVVLPKWIKKTREIGLVWEDMNKINKPKVSGSGGLIVIMGFILGVLVYIFLKTFYFKTEAYILEIFALSTSILILAGIGLVDDLLGWWRGGLSKKFRMFICLFAAVPLMVINAGNTGISIPFTDGTNLGIIYTLIIIPLGIMGASTTFNFLAGFNGLEASQGALIITALSFVAFFRGDSWLALIGLCFVAALLGFWFFNKFPARIFPGDVLTYPIGGMMAILAILGNFEKIAVFFFIPYITEVFLKSRGKLIKHSFGKPNKDDSLELPYDKIYGLEHFSILFLKKVKGKVFEKDVVYFINLIQLVVIALGFVIFREGIFLAG